MECSHVSLAQDKQDCSSLCIINVYGLHTQQEAFIDNIHKPIGLTDFMAPQYML